MMVPPAAKPLFAWDELEDGPSFRTVKELLDALPDATLPDSLRNARGKGRNDYPVHVLWGSSCCGTSPPRPCSLNVLIQRLGVAIPALGVDTAGDATAPSARRKSAEEAEETEASRGAEPALAG
jgi:hypothetical protein